MKIKIDETDRIAIFCSVLALLLFLIFGEWLTLSELFKINERYQELNMDEKYYKEVIKIRKDYNRLKLDFYKYKNSQKNKCYVSCN